MHGLRCVPENLSGRGDKVMEDKYDVVVVGAGPAGSTAAYSAAKNGARVLMVDRRRELGVPVQCGEAIAEDILNELGIKPDRRWAVNRTNAVKIVSPSGIEIRISEKKVTGKVGYVLNRKVFDKFLAVRAVKAGAEAMIGSYVNGLVFKNGRIGGIRGVGLDGKFEVAADVVIAADGVGSRVARWAGLNTALRFDDIETCAQFQMVGVDFESLSMLEFYLGSRISPGGYAWVFPKGCVGLPERRRFGKRWTWSSGKSRRKEADRVPQGFRLTDAGALEGEGRGGECRRGPRLRSH